MTSAATPTASPSTEIVEMSATCARRREATRYRRATKVSKLMSDVVLERRKPGPRLFLALPRLGGSLRLPRALAFLDVPIVRLAAWPQKREENHVADRMAVRQEHG